MSQSDVKPFDINKVDRYKNICIEASAGTGKTFTVQNIVAKLLTDKEPLNLEEILIVTFTEKAAGELKDRIRAKLQEENLTEQLAVVDNAPIYTIHSFCKQTLKEFSFEANQADSLDLCDESEVGDFIEKWIRDELSKNPDFQKYYKLSHGESINIKAYADAIGKYYLNYAGKEVPEIIQLDKTVSKDADIFRFSIDEFDEISECVSGKSFDVLKLNYIKNYWDKMNDRSITQPVTNIRQKDETACFISMIDTLKNELEAMEKVSKQAERGRGIELCNGIKKDYNNSNGSFIVKINKASFPKEAEDYITKTEGKKGLTITKTLADCCRYFSDLKTIINLLGHYNTIDECEARKSDLENYIFQTQLPEIYKAWNKYKKDNKLQTFDDMIRNVHETLSESDSKLKKVLQNKYKYAIIDEFQDTNQIQWDIFKQIFMADNKHAICVVGDPKQSIYAFQGADVNVYTAAKNEIAATDPENLPMNLTTNFRSTNEIIHFCNDIFKKSALEGQDDGPDFFKGNAFEFFPSRTPDEPNEKGVSFPEKVKPDATFEGKKIPSVWIPNINVDSETGAINPDGVSEEDFAKFAVKQILECCKKDKNQKTRLQVYKKVNGECVLSNVTFADFAVLCKSKTEMVDIKREFSESGIPFNHYKEDNLFGGKECRDWISLFNAICVPDFSATNRTVLNECLYSSFFGIPLAELRKKAFDEPQNPQRIKILKWKKTALGRNWALLQEQIYEDSMVEQRLSDLDKLGSLSKLRQIGDYCVNYLYKNNCSINDLVDHLILLTKKITDIDDEGGALVEKGTDFDAVKIMTVHASKGLEFPVVIAPAGLKGVMNSSRTGVYTYHDNSGRLHLTCDSGYQVPDMDKSVSEIWKYESELEYQRLYYVAYTRATSIMILHWSSKTDYKCLNDITRVCGADNEHLQLIEHISEKYDVQENKIEAQGILSNLPAETSADGTQKEQEKVLEELVPAVRNLGAIKVSYTSLSHGAQEKKNIVDGDFSEHSRNRSSKKEDDNSEFDLDSRKIECNYDTSKLFTVRKDYPKGNLLGEAVHQTFEEAGFKRIGELSEEEAVKDKILRGLIRRKFQGQGFTIDPMDSKKIVEQTCKMVWNTLKAELPEIQGNDKTGRSFTLSQLQDHEHYAELEFNMNPEIEINKLMMKDYFNGFIDLLFFRKNKDGNKIYSIVDWKTNSMDEAVEYANPRSIQNLTAENFSIQRVLYSYCLIKWLKQFTPDKNEQWIFENQFGGIYYVYVRGCKVGTGNGIYAQTWENWAALEKAFNEIVLKKLSRGNK